MASPLRDLGCLNAGCQPCGHASVTQIVRSSSQRRGVLPGLERFSACVVPHAIDGLHAHRVLVRRRERNATVAASAGAGNEQPAANACPMLLDVFAQDLDQVGVSGDGPTVVLGAVLQFAFLAGLSVVGPVATGLLIALRRTISPHPSSGSFRSASRRLRASAGRRAA